MPRPLHLNFPVGMDIRVLKIGRHDLRDPLPPGHQFLYLPGLSRHPRAHQLPGPPHQCRLRGYQHAPQGPEGPPAPLPGPALRLQGPHLPPPGICGLQGPPPPHARRPGQAAPLYPKNHPGTEPAQAGNAGLRGRRPDRHPGGAGPRPGAERGDCFRGQGSAAPRAGGGGHVGPHEERPLRLGGHPRQIRRDAGRTGGGEGPGRRPQRQYSRGPGDRGKDRFKTHRPISHPGKSSRAYK